MIRKQFSFWEGKLDFVIARPKSTFSLCASLSQVMHIQQINQFHEIKNTYPREMFTWHKYALFFH